MQKWSESIASFSRIQSFFAQLPDRRRTNFLVTLSTLESTYRHTNIRKRIRRVHFQFIITQNTIIPNNTLSPLEETEIHLFIKFASVYAFVSTRCTFPLPQLPLLNSIVVSFHPSQKLKIVLCVLVAFCSCCCSYCTIACCCGFSFLLLISKRFLLLLLRFNDENFLSLLHQPVRSRWEFRFSQKRDVNTKHKMLNRQAVQCMYLVFSMLSKITIFYIPQLP